MTKKKCLKNRCKKWRELDECCSIDLEDLRCIRDPNMDFYDCFEKKEKDEGDE
jgi:hypothetical protein